MSSFKKKSGSIGSRFGYRSSDRRSAPPRGALRPSETGKKPSTSRTNSTTRQPSYSQPGKALRVIRRAFPIQEVKWKNPAKPSQTFNLFQPNSKTGKRQILRQTEKTPCEARKDRRKVLFAYSIAGKNLRKSPGQGGTYKRTELSKYSC